MDKIRLHFLKENMGHVILEMNFTLDIQRCEGLYDYCQPPSMRLMVVIQSITCVKYNDTSPTLLTQIDNNSAVEPLNSHNLQHFQAKPCFLSYNIFFFPKHVAFLYKTRRIHSLKER